MTHYEMVSGRAANNQMYGYVALRNGTLAPNLASIFVDKTASGNKPNDRLCSVRATIITDELTEFEICDSTMIIEPALITISDRLKRLLTDSGHEVTKLVGQVMVQGQEDLFEQYARQYADIRRATSQD